MKRRYPLSALLVCTFFLGEAKSARADNGSIAEELFREARQAMQQDDYATACPKFTESQRLDPSVGTLLNVALCEEHAGRVATAWGDFRAVIDQLPPRDRRMPIAQAHLKALEPRVPKLKLNIEGWHAADVEIDLDGTLLLGAAFESELPVDPGHHVVGLGGMRAETEKIEFEIGEGEHIERTLKIDPPPSTASSAAAPTASGASNAPNALAPSRNLTPERAPAAQDVNEHGQNAQRTWGYATGAFGVAAVAASAILGGFALHEQSLVNKHCVGHACDGEGLAAGKRGTRLETWANVSFGVGVLALGGAVYLVLSAPVAAPGTPRATQGPTSLQIRGTF